MPFLDSKIDALYARPLDEFVAARLALAKTLTGDEAARVKRLQKPTAVPWAANQVYWHARPLYDNLLKSGKSLTAAQIAGLRGRSPADLRAASDTHRKAIAEAASEAMRLASRSGLHVALDKVAETFEALSLARQRSEPDGRLTKPLQPAGFEALAGIVVKSSKPAQTSSQPAAQPSPTSQSRGSTREAVEAAERRDRAARKQRAAETRKAEADLARAQVAERRAKTEWEQRKRALDEAQRALDELSRDTEP